MILNDQKYLFHSREERGDVLRPHIMLIQAVTAYSKIYQQVIIGFAQISRTRRMISDFAVHSSFKDLFPYGINHCDLYD